MADQLLSVADDIVGQYKTVRETLLEILDECNAIAAAIPALSEFVALEKLFERSRAHISESTLSVVVLGSEGVGKSTLIRGIFGQELSPIEGFQPGTVAPVRIVYGERNEPDYIVEFSAPGQGPRECSKEEFLSYVQQKSNPGNVKGVRCGRVHINHRLLAAGLEMVDLPGVGGINEAVRTEVMSYIKRQASTVIGVCRDRSFGPIAEIAQSLSISPERQLTFQAVVANRSLDFFTDQGQQALSDDDVKLAIQRARDEGYPILREELARQGVATVPSLDDLFVFSANTMFSRSGVYASPAHILEIERFDRHIWHYMRRTGMVRAIDRCALETEDAIGRVQQVLQVHEDNVKGVVHGDNRILERIKEDLTSAFRIFWQNTGGSEEFLEYFMSEHWPALQRAFNNSQDEIERALQEAEKLIDSDRSGSQARSLKQISEDTHRKLNQLANEPTTAVKRYGDELVERLLAEANRVMNEGLKNVPYLSKHGQIVAVVDAKDILVGHEIEARFSNDGPNRLRAIMDGVGLTGAVGAGGYMVAFLDPTGISAGVLLGSLLLPVAGRLLGRIHGYRPEDAARESIQKSLKSFRDKKAERRDQFRNWVRSHTEQCQRSVDAALKLKIDQLKALVGHLPNADHDAASAELHQIDRVSKDLNATLAKLASVSNYAHSLTERSATHV